MNRPRLTQDGFTLLETVCVMAIIAMLAAVLLPLLPRATSRPRLEAYAMETAALLNRDRTAAMQEPPRGVDQGRRPFDPVRLESRASCGFRTTCRSTPCCRSAATEAPARPHHQLFRHRHVMRRHHHVVAARCGLRGSGELGDRRDRDCAAPGPVTHRAGDAVRSRLRREPRARSSLESAAPHR